MTDEKLVRKRPFGVTVIVVVQLVAMVSLIVDLYEGAESSLTPVFLGFREVPAFPVLSGAIFVYQLIVAVGLWRLKRWAWFLIMIQLGIGMSFSLWFYFNGTSLYNYMLFNVIMVFYLNQREVQGAFEHRTKAQKAAT